MELLILGRGDITYVSELTLDIFPEIELIIENVKGQIRTYHLRHFIP